MNLKLLIKKHKSKINILIFLLVIINIAYFIFHKKIDQKKVNYFSEYRLSFYIDKEDILKNFEGGLSISQLNIPFSTQSFLNKDRSQFEYYIKEIRDILNDEGFLFKSVKIGQSLNTSYKIDLEFQDRQHERNLEVKQVMIDRLKDILINLENKIFSKEINEINLEYRFKYLLSSLSFEKRKFRKMEEYLKSQQIPNTSNPQIFSMMQYQLMNDLITREETLKELVRIYNKIINNNLYVIVKNQELKKNNFKEDTYKINDLNRLNILNINIGGLLLGLLLILFNEVRVNFYQNLIGKKKNS